MREILTDGRTKDAGFGFKPGDARTQAIGLQTDRGTDCQADVVTLRDFQAVLSALNTSELLETTMVDFNLPGIRSMECRFFDTHLQLTGCRVY
jgi:hypothetical protein